MSPYELLDISLAIGNRIDVQWGLFITVHLAIFGGIIYVDRPLRLAEKTGALVMYYAFSVLNFRVLQVQLGLLHGAHTDIARFAGDPCCADLEVIREVAEHVGTGRFAFGHAIAVGGPIVMALLVTLAVVFDQKITASAKGPATARNEPPR